MGFSLHSHHWKVRHDEQGSEETCNSYSLTTLSIWFFVHLILKSIAEVNTVFHFLAKEMSS